MLKIRLTVVMIAISILAACAANNSVPPQTTRINQLSVQPSNPADVIKILSAKTVVKRGENGVIVMRGRPGVIYSISATYNAGGKTLVATERETARTDGIVTWNWFVAARTSPGEYPIEIKGGGTSYRMTYTVIE